MKDLPIVICTSVIRSSQQGESHGGMYLVNFNTGKFKQVVDWNDQTIDWTGRGADRGLRGIAFYEGQIIAAASDEIFFYDQDFEIVKSFRNPYLKHCHEIFIDNDQLYLSSTGYDSILEFDLRTEKFIKGYCYRQRELITTGFDLIDRKSRKLTPENVEAFVYEPFDQEGPEPEDTLHINNVFHNGGQLYFSGRHMKKLIRIDPDNRFRKVAKIPKGTHNVQFIDNHLIMNSTDHDQILIADNSANTISKYELPYYGEDQLENNNLGKDHARQAFGRGLCVNEDFFVGGSSPGTLSLYERSQKAPLISVNLTLDIRNAIHGLEFYPYPLNTL